MAHQGVDHAAHAHPAATTPDSLAALFDAYLLVQDALAADDLPAARTASQALSVALSSDPLSTHADVIANAGDLVEARLAFGALSVEVARLAEAHGASDLTLFRCGMARAPMGGVWLQRGTSTRNPYFGASMLMCGSRIDALPEAPTGGGHDGH